jgi:serine phosphatase RsbU (regulator of sigma subunit)
MKKLLIIIISVLALFRPIIAQINKVGVPFVKNYTREEYKAEEQNWAVCTDNRGVVYFGNNEAILEFDGVNWTTIPNANNSIIRSLAVDSIGTVYVGGVDEIGYLTPDIYGKQTYHSLTSQVKATFKDVWRIYIINNDVYFCSSKDIFIFRNKKLIKSYQNPEGGFISFYVNNKIYWGDYRGLKVIENDSVIDALGGIFYKDMDIFAMLPFSENKVFVGTIGHGCYIYDTETGKSENIKSINKNFKFLSDILVNSQLYQGIKLNDGSFGFSTIQNGYIIANIQGEIIYHFDKKLGWKDNTVISSYQGKDGILWLALNTGISSIEINSPFTAFDPTHGIEGIINDVINYNNTLYVATTNGIYYLYFDKDNLPRFNRAPIDYIVWSFNIFKTPEGKEKLIIANQLGVYELVSNYKLVRISNKPYDTRSIFQSKVDKNKLYVGHLAGLALLEYKNGVWIDNGEIFEKKYTVESIVEDKEGSLWLSTGLNGIIKVEKDNVIEYGLSKGLPALDKNKVYSIHNEILITTRQGVFYIDQTKDSILKYKGFGDEIFKRTDLVSGIYPENDSVFWFLSKFIDKKNIDNSIEYIERVTKDNDKITISKIPFNRIKKFSFQSITPGPDGSAWFSSSIEAIHFNPKINIDETNNYYSLVRKVNITIDSILFWGTNYVDTSNLTISLVQADYLKSVQDFKHNNITFYFSSPYFPTEELKYRYKLEGFEEEWSNWDFKTYKEYTNLNEGTYIFKIEAQNIYGVQSEVAEYEFSILPPWYRTVWALILYILAAIGVIVITVKLYTRKLQLEKIRLEQIVKERTEEVVKQKDEILLQRDEIAEKNKSITDSIEYAKRIQTAVLPSKEFEEEVLPEHFILFRPRDIVSGDFYWFTKKDNLLIITAADCTGHGVPGAFMSMLGVSFLNEIVNKHDIRHASEILNHLRSDVKKTLSQTGKEGEAKDGMDIALVIVDLENMKMQYAGAYNPMYMYRNNELMEFKGDRNPIGIYVKEKDSFTNNEIDLQKGDVFYIFSDGYEDQFGGENGDKFKSKNFKIFLQEIHQKPMSEQRELLNTNIENWRGKWEQVDDIIVLGVRIP